MEVALNDREGFEVSQKKAGWEMLVGTGKQVWFGETMLFVKRRGNWTLSQIALK